MQYKIAIVHQPAPQGDGLYEKITLFGKKMWLPAVSADFRIIVHLDFPLITAGDIDAFIAARTDHFRPAMTCRRVRVHPYRLMAVGSDGFDHFLVDVPQTVRGNRHLYPDVFEFVPALIAIPPCFNALTLPSLQEIDMYVVDGEKLLDKANLLDNLLLKGRQSDADG